MQTTFAPDEFIQLDGLCVQAIGHVRLA